VVVIFLAKMGIISIWIIYERTSHGVVVESSGNNFSASVVFFEEQDLTCRYNSKIDGIIWICAENIHVLANNFISSSVWLTNVFNVFRWRDDNTCWVLVFSFPEWDYWACHTEGYRVDLHVLDNPTVNEWYQKAPTIREPYMWVQLGFHRVKDYFQIFPEDKARVSFWKGEN
jgi:hypothetical protein